MGRIHLRYVQALRMAACFLVASVHAHAQIACRYEVSTVIAGPDCFGTPSPLAGVAISPNSEYVCGYWINCLSGNQRAFVYTASTNQAATLPLPTGFSSMTAWDVNDNGVVVGDGFKTGAGQKGWVYDIASGQYSILDPLPGGAACFARSVNASNVVCGWRSIGPGLDPKTAFTWTATNGGTFVDLGLVNEAATTGVDISATGVVTGVFKVGIVPQPFIWEGKSLESLGTLKDMETYPRAINDNHQVVGWSAVPQATYPFQGSHAFLWDMGNLLDLGFLPGDNRGVASAINSTGTVVGLSRFLTEQVQIDHAFIWYEGEMRNLQGLIDGVSGVVLYDALAISDNGVIVAFGSTPPGFTKCIILSPVPSSPGDIDANCRVDIDDLILVINHWGQSKSPADINQDGSVDIEDLLIVINSWSA